MSITMAQAVKKQKLYRAYLVQAVLAAMQLWAKRDWKPNVLTKHMVRLPIGKPALPPPGPLGIRSGHLARTIRYGKPIYQGGKFSIPLLAGGGNVAYARIHEKGGRAGRNLSARIPKRPYMKPAYMDTKGKLTALMEQNINAMHRRVWG